MKVFATHRSWSSLPFVLGTALLVLFAARAEAQISNPLWDHYKVYEVFGPPYPTSGVPVTLIDQFLQSTHTVQTLEKFMNPVEKRHLPQPGQIFPINDGVLHYTWWRITPHPFGALVAVDNQFGDQTLNVFQPRFLLAPALKNQTGQPPNKNHYKCYDCQGPPVNRNVALIDQFDQPGTQWNVTVNFPRYFCNPVEKRVPGGPTGEIIYPRTDINQHYVCYDYTPEDTRPRTASVTDQFVLNRTLDFFTSRLLCVPTDKNLVTETKQGTWGKLKQLYR